MPVHNLEPPVGGLNSRDSLDEIGRYEAITLVNWWPDLGYLRSRLGFALYCDLGTGTPVETMMTLNLTSGSYLTAASDLKLFDITDPLNIITLTLPETPVSNRYTYAQFKGVGIITQDGITPMIYDPLLGTVVSGTFTPDARLDTTKLVKPLVFKGRVIYVDASRKSIWYAEAGSFQGDLTEFPLDGVYQRGGAIRLLFTWSKDTGDGMDDMLVIQTSTGETLVYQGDDPSDTLGWELIQRYQLPEPLSDLGIARVGSEQIIMTDDGYVNLSEAISEGQVSDYATFSSKIARLVATDVANYKENYGWSSVFYSRGNMIIFNVPIVENNQHYQHVINTRNGSWTTFEGINANSMITMLDRLFYGMTDGFVMLGDVGTSDDGDYIRCNCVTAYTNLNNRAQMKHITAVAINHNHTHATAFSIDALTDYAPKVLPPLIPPAEESQAQWDVSDWDADHWASDSEGGAGSVYRRPVIGHGHVVSFSVRQSSREQTIRWYNYTVEWTMGGRK